MALDMIKKFANSKILTAIFGVSTAVAATNVMAQDNKYPFFVYDNPNNPTAPQCHDQGQVMAALKADGQLEIIGGRRMIDVGPYNIVTVNTKGYMYNFEQNKTPSGNQLCLRLKAKFAVADNSETRPQWTKTIQRNGTIDPDGLYEKGGRIWAGAHAFSLSKDGKEIPGKLLAVASSKLNSEKMAEGGGIWEINNRGIPETSLPLLNVKVNTQNIAFLMQNGVGPEKR